MVFNLLIRRPWKHSAGAILSKLASVSFISGNKLVVVMAEDDVHVLASTMVQFIDTQQMNTTSKYHYFKFVSVNCIPEGGVFLKPKLSMAELMIMKR